MRKLSYHLSVLFFTLAIFSGCKKENSPTDSEIKMLPASSSSNTQGRLSACGTPLQVGLFNFGGGSAEISNDATNVYVMVTSSDPAFKLQTIKLAYGTVTHLSNDISYSSSSLVGIVNPDLTVNVAPIASTYTVTIPRSSLTECFSLNVFALVTDGINTNNNYGIWIFTNNPINSYSWSSYVNYCMQSCPPPPPPPGDCGQLRTQTPGGWGAVPQGNNPGTYLHANFNTAFPQGLAIGCYPGNFYVRFTNAQAITDLLPTGGTAKALTANYLNSLSHVLLKNVLIGHMTALTLSVGFDSADPNFGQAGIHLGDMLIGSGTFANWTVSDFLSTANMVLGGCSNAYTPGQILATASAINENYVDGTTNMGYLVCP